VVPLHSGTEATVSTKSYLNSLAAHQVLLGPPAPPTATVADLLEAWLSEPDPLPVDGVPPRLAVIGTGDQYASALTGALIMQEAAKVPAQAYTAGQFRHGPLELAGPGLTALLIDDPDSTANDLGRLRRDLVATGATAIDVPVPSGQSLLSRLVYAAQALQRYSVALAHANGVEPGAFRYGQKITEAR
jgi:glucosamine--fructose-6-phosphate aminotransferase (isomerizing)